MNMQNDFMCLSVPDWQHAGIMQKLGDHVAFSGSGSSIKLEETISYVPENFISEETYAVLAAFEASALLRDHENDTFISGIGFERSISMPTALSHDSWSFMVSPKKFPRTFWKSIARRLVEQNEAM